MTLAAMDTETRIDQALCRGIVYDVLAMSLQVPSSSSIERFRGGDAFDALRDAAEVLSNGRPDASSKASLKPAIEALVLAGRESSLSELKEEYERLFGHTMRGKIPPYETEYGSGGVFHQEQELADLGGFYAAFGLVLPPSRRERDDHIAAECEFLSFLACKEAHDLVEGRLDQREEIERVARVFLRDHAGRFGRAFGRKLVQEARHPFYTALGRLLLELLAWDCSFHDVKAGPEILELRSDVEPEVPMACGSCKLAELAGGGESAPEE